MRNKEKARAVSWGSFDPGSYQRTMMKDTVGGPQDFYTMAGRSGQEDFGARLITWGPDHSRRSLPFPMNQGERGGG